METFIFVKGRQVGYYGDAKPLTAGSVIYLDDNTPLEVLDVKVDDEAQMIDAEPTVV